MIHKRSIQYLSMFLGAIGVSVALALPQANAASFQQLLQAAREEATKGPLIVWASNPRGEKTRQALFKAFRKKYNLAGLEFDWLLLHPRDAAPRVIAETRAGKSGPDIFQGSGSTALGIKNEGMFEPFDFAGTFRGEFPGINEPAVDRVPKVLRGNWVMYYDATRSFNFNTKQIKLSEVPDSIEELAEPKWSRKFIIGGSSPFDLFSKVWGEERTVNIVKKLIANRPIYKRGTPATVNAVAAGEAPIGFGSLHEGERLKAKGAPIEWKTYGKYIPVLAQGFAVTKNASHPNLARLFQAWIAMEGILIMEKRDFSTRITNKNSVLSKIIKKRVPNAEVLAPNNAKEFKFQHKMARKIRKMIATGRKRR